MPKPKTPPGLEKKKDKQQQQQPKQTERMWRGAGSKFMGTTK